MLSMPLQGTHSLHQAAREGMIDMLKRHEIQVHCRRAILTETWQAAHETSLLHPR
jgi:hypothetical protein